MGDKEQGTEEKEEGLQDETPGDSEKKDVQEDTQDKTEETEQKEDEELKEEKEPADFEKSETQKRFDELTAMSIEAQRIIKEQAETINKLSSGNGGDKKKETTWEDYTDQELKNLALEKPEYAETCESILEQRKEDRLLGKLESKQTMIDQINESYAKIEEKLPEYARKGTPEWTAANEVFVKMGLNRFPDGPYLAALYAKDILEKGKPDRTNMLRKQLDKERSKKTLASGRGGSGKISVSAEVEKAFKAAQGTEAGSVEWKRYIKLSRAVRLKNEE